MKTRTALASLIMLCSALMTIVGSAPANAYESYHSGQDVGVHYDADVTCSGSPYRDITVRPVMGTTVGWEWGQNVAIRVYVLDSRGNVTGTLTGSTTAWTNLRIATTYSTGTDINGNPMVINEPYKMLGPYKWNLGPGTYSVRVDYAWQTNRGWSYATNVTSSYTISSAIGGYWYNARDTKCTIN